VSDDAEVPLNRAPSLTIVKEATGIDADGDGLINQAGDKIDYTITVTNTGNQTLSNVTVTDPLTGLNENIGNLFPGEVGQFMPTYTVSQADLDGNGGGDGDIDIVATADSEETEPVSDDAEVPLNRAPSLTIVKEATGIDADGDGLINQAGDKIDYKITVTNTGNQTLSNVTVTDPLTGLNENIGDLVPGGIGILSTTYTVSQADLDGNGGGDGDIDNTATVDSEETEPVSDDAEVEVIVKASLGDLVFEDLDRDGIQDAGEPGVQVISVELQDCNGNTLASTTTDANGNYLFEGLDPGSYVVVFGDLPEGYQYTTADAGGDDALDSDAGEGGATGCLELAAGETNLTVDAGIVAELIDCPNCIVTGTDGPVCPGSLQVFTAPIDGACENPVYDWTIEGNYQEYEVSEDGSSVTVKAGVDCGFSYTVAVAIDCEGCEPTPVSCTPKEVLVNAESPSLVGVPEDLDLFYSPGDCIIFEDFQPGEIVSSVFSSGGRGPIRFFAYNPEFPDVNTAMIFDTDNPAFEDLDLGSPNETFGGPGIGNDGEFGMPFQNDRALGKVLIVSDDLDPNTPADERIPGTYIDIDMEEVAPVTVISMDIVDLEVKQESFVEMFDAKGDPIRKIHFLADGNNGLLRLDLENTDNVALVRVFLNGSGAIDNFCFIDPSEISLPEPPVVTASDNCDPALQVDYEQTISAGRCAEESIITRTWTATGSCGIATETQVIRIMDNLPPKIIGVPRDLTISGGSLPKPVEPIVVDNLDREPSLEFAETEMSDGVVRTWTARDACGNETSVSQRIRLEQDLLSITAFVLVDADADQSVPAFDPLEDGALLNLNDLPVRLNVKAMTKPGTVGSVLFSLEGPRGVYTPTENVKPYALFGDQAGDFASGDLQVGNYILTATPYTGQNGSGEAGSPLTIYFSVIEGLVDEDKDGYTSDVDCDDNDETVTNEGFSVMEEETICLGETLVFGQLQITEAGEYKQTFQSVNGCDSVVTLTVFVDSESAECRPTCSATGSISFEKWNGVSGLLVSDIPLESEPDETGQLNAFYIPTNVGSNYGMRLRGFICPPETGEYTFWIASDDQGALFLSTDDNPANKVQIAGVPTWSPFQDWDKHPEQQSDPITLQAGQQYYVEALFKEAGGGDHLSVAWRLPSENFNLPGGPIPGQYLSPFEGGGPAPNQLPNADLQANVTSGDAPLTVNFDASGSNDPDGTIVSYVLTANGNQIGTGVTPTYIFEDPGTFNVELTVTDNEGATDVAMLTITVSDPNAATCSATGSISFEKWNNVPGLVISDIPLESNPDETGLLNEFNIPTNVGSSYGMRLRGFICPPETGEYTFWIASDDQGALFLSTDDNPANKVQIAGVPTWSPFQDWDKHPEQQSDPITLQAGQQYYVEALFKEAGGGDHLSVAWRLPSENFNLPGGPIPGQYLSPFEGGSFNLDPSVGALLEAKVSDADFRIFPNPTTGAVNLSLDYYLDKEVDIRMMDARGSLIWQQRHFKVEKPVYQLDLNPFELANGLYTISVITQEGVLTKPLQVMVR